MLFDQEHHLKQYTTLVSVKSTTFDDTLRDDVDDYGLSGKKTTLQKN